jgi:hypothetical protein
MACPVQLGLTPDETHDNQLSTELLMELQGRAGSALPLEQIVLAGKAFANEIEEGTDPRGSLQVSVGHDP